MECLAAACQWLCQATPTPAPVRPGARPEESDEEFGPFQMADARQSASTPEDQEKIHSAPHLQNQLLSDEETETDLEEHCGSAQKICRRPTEKPALPDVSHTAIFPQQSDEQGSQSPCSTAASEEAPLLRNGPHAVDDLQWFSVSGQWPKSPASAEEADTDSQARGTTIRLNVYHLTQSEGVQWFNTVFAYEHAPVKLLGLFHVGVQVGDEEWAFGATLGGSGVCRHKPRGADQHHFHHSIVMGSTTLSKRELDVLYRTLEGSWSGGSYCPLQNNCIHFASEVCGLLDVADVPAWVNRPARLGSFFLGKVFNRLPKPPMRSRYL